MSEQITSLPGKIKVPEPIEIAAVEAAGVGAALAGALLCAGVAATDGAADGAGVTGATVGALVAADVQADRVMAATASAVAAVRNERMQDLLQEHAELFDAGVTPGRLPAHQEGMQRITQAGDWVSPSPPGDNDRRGWPGLRPKRRLTDGDPESP